MPPTMLETTMPLLVGAKGIASLLIAFHLLLFFIRHARLVVLTSLAFTVWFALYLYLDLAGAVGGFVVLGWIYLKTRRGALR